MNILYSIYITSIDWKLVLIAPLPIYKIYETGVSKNTRRAAIDPIVNSSHSEWSEVKFVTCSENVLNI